MADGSLPQAKLRKPPLYNCVCCDVPTYLRDMNDDMQCESCGGPIFDPEDFAPSESELRISERTY